MKDQGTLNISTMSSKDWYRVMLEDNITMETSENGEARLIKLSYNIQIMIGKTLAPG